MLLVASKDSSYMVLLAFLLSSSENEAVTWER